MLPLRFTKSRHRVMTLSREIQTELEILKAAGIGWLMPLGGVHNP